MNILAPHVDHEDSAEFLDDTHLISQCHDLGQILSTAIRTIAPETKLAIFPEAEVDDSILKYVTKSDTNYASVLYLFRAYLDEFNHRFEQRHQCSDMFFEFTDGYNLMPTGSYNFGKFLYLPKIPGKKVDTHKGHRAYLKQIWKTEKVKPKWTKRTEQKYQ